MAPRQGQQGTPGVIARQLLTGRCEGEKSRKFSLLLEREGANEQIKYFVLIVQSTFVGAASLDANGGEWPSIGAGKRPAINLRPSLESGVELGLRVCHLLLLGECLTWASVLPTGTVIYGCGVPQVYVYRVQRLLRL